MEEVKDFLPVSRETHKKLQDFSSLLQNWQHVTQLVSHKDMGQLWERHIVDSGQLVSYLPDRNRAIVDVGSGAGFPGIVLAILGCGPLFLIESNQRKAAFLNEVRRHFNLSVTVIPRRVEDCKGLVPEGSYITARAVTSTHHFLQLTASVCDQNSVYVLLKGKTARQEVTEAQKKWRFDWDMHSSHTGEGKILVLRHVEPCT